MDIQLNKVKIILCNFFSKRFPLHKDIIDFFEFNFGISGYDDIKEILLQDLSLLNLIISLDKESISSIYSHIPGFISEEYIERLSLELEKDIHTIKIVFKETIINVPPNKEFFQDFLKRLKFHVFLPHSVLNFVKRSYPETYGQILYKLKKIPILWDENMISFFEMFFLRFKHKQDIDSYLDILLSVFVKHAKVINIKENLEKRIQQLKDICTQVVSTQEKINSKGLEFVLISREPILDISPHILETEIVILEEIYYTLFPLS